MLVDVGKNQRGDPYFFSSDFSFPKIKGKYLIIEGGAVPDNKNGKSQIWCLFRGGLFRGGAVPVD